MANSNEEKSVVDVVEALYVEGDKVVQESVDVSLGDRIGRVRLLYELEELYDTEFDTFELYVLRNLFRFTNYIEPNEVQFDSSEENVDEEVIEAYKQLQQVQKNNRQLRTTQVAVEKHQKELNASLKHLGAPWQAQPHFFQHYLSTLTTLTQKAAGLLNASP